MNSRLLTFFAFACGLLLLAIGGERLARIEPNAEPSATSVRPSGAAALAELLRRNGYSVRIDRNARPQVNPDEIAVVFRSSQSTSGSKRAYNIVADSARSGAGLIDLPLPEQFGQAVKAAEASPFPVRRITDGATRTLAADSANLGDEGESSQTLYGGDLGAAVSMRYLGRGVVVEFSDGIVATNRLLDHADNARVLLEAFRVAGKGKKAVFTEATFADFAPGLLGTIGPWAPILVYQSLFLVVVAIVTLGRRYGLGDSLRNRVRSSRDLADGIADMMNRGRMAGTALDILLEDKRRGLKGAATLTRQQIVSDRNLTPEEALNVARENL